MEGVDGLDGRSSVMEASMEYAVGQDFILKKIWEPQRIMVWICVSEQGTGGIRAQIVESSDPLENLSSPQISPFSL